MLVNERIPAGTVLKISRTEETDGKKHKVARVYCVTEQYRHHVLAVRKGGIRSCITHAELFQNGIVTQRIDEIPGWMKREPGEKRGPQAEPRRRGEKE